MGAQRKSGLPTTADEFLKWPGDGKGGKYQLVDGELRAMSPGSATHGAIQSNVAALLTVHLRTLGGRCRAYTEPAIEVRTRAKINTRIPDVGVSCAKIAAGDIALPEPVLLVEILSPGNSSDPWDNVWAYCTIPSVTEILVLASTRIEAQLLRRGADGHWPHDPTKIELEGSLTLESIDYAVPLKAIYEGTYLVEA